MTTKAEGGALPSNCVFEGNGNFVCRNESGRFDIWQRGEGWWAFDIATVEEAIHLAKTYPTKPRAAPPEVAVLSGRGDRDT